MKKYIYSFILIIIFIGLIQWMVDFKFLQFSDIKLMIVLSLGTLILLLLQNNSKYYKEQFRFFLFFTASIMSLFMMYAKLPNELNNLEIVVTISLKPFLYAMLLYFPGNSLLEYYYYHHPDQSDWQTTLSRRENEVYALLLNGLSNKEISTDLYIAESTVKKHVQNILKKANMDNRASLIKNKKKGQS